MDTEITLKLIHLSNQTSGERNIQNNFHSSFPFVDILIASDIDETLSILEHIACDVVMIDLNQQPQSAIWNIKSIRKISKIRIIVFLKKEYSSSLPDLKKAGACGFIIEKANSDEIFECLETVLKGKTFISPLLKENVFDNTDKTAGEQSEITDKILFLISHKKTTSEIIEQLHITEKEFEQIQKNLYRKSNSKKLAGIIKFAMKSGVYDNAGLISKFLEGKE